MINGMIMPIMRGLDNSDANLAKFLNLNLHLGVRGKGRVSSVYISGVRRKITVIDIEKMFINLFQNFQFIHDTLNHNYRLIIIIPHITNLIRYFYVHAVRYQNSIISGFWRAGTLTNALYYSSDQAKSRFFGAEQSFGSFFTKIGRYCYTDNDSIYHPIIIIFTLGNPDMLLREIFPHRLPIILFTGCGERTRIPVSYRIFVNDLSVQNLFFFISLLLDSLESALEDGETVYDGN